MQKTSIGPRSGPSLGVFSAAPDGEGPGTASDKGARILIVEDDYFVAMSLEHGLKEAGYHIVGIAASASEAVKLAKEGRPVLAIMDIRLAGNSDGIEAA